MASFEVQGTIHIIGAGLAGLAAAVCLAGGPQNIVLHEAARQAGGRCRSYFDSTLGMIIDNGNHLLLSGNRDARAFLAATGSEDQLSGPPGADFAFIDLQTGRMSGAENTDPCSSPVMAGLDPAIHAPKPGVWMPGSRPGMTQGSLATPPGIKWHLRPNRGPFPWWIFSPRRRVPGTGAGDYFELLRLFLLRRDAPLASVLRRRGVVYERLWRPFFLAALNIEPAEASAHLAAAVVKETLARGGGACRPLFAGRGLTAAFIDPALKYLARLSVMMRFEHRLRSIVFANGRAAALEFGEDAVPLGAEDRVILAVPSYAACEIVPGLQAPDSYRAIVNAHFRLTPPCGFPPILGIIHGTAEWLFAFPDRLSVTISNAGRLLDIPREELAQIIWADVAKVTQIEKPLPPWQIIKEKRATFAATVEENARRPGAQTAYKNLFLAGDWTATGLPATIEGALRSGNRAADLIAASY